VSSQQLQGQLQTERCADTDYITNKSIQTPVTRSVYETAQWSNNNDDDEDNDDNNNNNNNNHHHHHHHSSNDEEHKDGAKRRKEENTMDEAYESIRKEARMKDRERRNQIKLVI
jgi:hypothetical protein